MYNNYYYYSALSSHTSRSSVISPLTVQTVTVGNFNLPITCLLIYVERQTRRASNLFHTSFSAPEGQNAFMQYFDVLVKIQKKKKKNIVNLNMISFDVFF